MSGVVSIRAALETALAAMSPSLSTAYENVAFTPVAGTPYQRAETMFARPDNREISANFVEQGIFQVTLCYPTGTGPAAAAARAELIRSTFKRGNSFASGGVTTLITDTPEVMPAYVDADRYCVPVRVRFMAQVTAS
jgi:hypothetical protein